VKRITSDSVLDCSKVSFFRRDIGFIEQGNEFSWKGDFFMFLLFLSCRVFVPQTSTRLCFMAEFKKWRERRKLEVLHVVVHTQLDTKIIHKLN
jgi:hypothetical protein